MTAHGREEYGLPDNAIGTIGTIGEPAVPTAPEQPTKEQFLDTWPEHEKGWTHRAMEMYLSLYGESAPPAPASGKWPTIRNQTEAKLARAEQELSDSNSLWHRLVDTGFLCRNCMHVSPNDKGDCTVCEKLARAEQELKTLREAGKALLQYLDDHDWGTIPEGQTADNFRDALKE